MSRGAGLDGMCGAMGVKASPGVLLLKDVNVSLAGTADGALNQTFDTNLFTGGLLFGLATVIATTER